MTESIGATLGTVEVYSLEESGTEKPKRRKVCKILSGWNVFRVPRGIETSSVHPFMSPELKSNDLLLCLEESMTLEPIMVQIQFHQLRM